MRSIFPLSSPKLTFVGIVIAGWFTSLVWGGASTSPAPAADLPGWISLAPPTVAILAALLWRSIVPALFVGVWIGAWAVAGLDGPGLFHGLLAVFEVHVLNAVANKDHATILLFSMMIGGMVGICLENGGMRGMAFHLAKLASTRRRGQGATASLGLFVFFDDYANLLIVGNVMRPITDKLNISREKLAYLVDSTAAPVASVGLMTTWIGFEVGLLDESLRAIGTSNVQPYGVFLHSLAYSFYPWLTLFLIFLVAATGRDFGPMAKAEQAAAIEGVPSIDPAINLSKAKNSPIEKAAADERASPVYALLPIGVMVVAMLLGLTSTGEGDSLWQRIATADAMTSLLRGSLLGVLAAVGVSLVGRRLSLQETMLAWYRGVESVLLGLITLVLAWALANTTELLDTAEYLGSWVEGNVSVAFLPAIIFVLAGLVSLSTGSAWGTMGLLMPLAVPLVWQQAGSGSETQAEELIAATVAAVLGGAVFGDHCSPISDTTILSSTACGCDHLSHVRTQFPYALLGAGVATIVGTIPASLGAPPLLCLGVSAGVLALLFFALSSPFPSRQGAGT